MLGFLNPLPYISEMKPVSAHLDGLLHVLAALEWIAPEVIAVQLDQIERIQKYAFVVTPVSNTIEVTPFSSQATASPSMMQDREHRRLGSRQSTRTGKSGHCQVKRLKDLELENSRLRKPACGLLININDSQIGRASCRE